MYRKNTASQYVYFCLVNASTGAALTGATVTAYRALDNGSQATATGTTTELANGQYRFNLSQADTNGNYGSYLFTATNAVPVEKTVVFTAANPQDGGAFGLNTIQTIDNNVDAVESVVNSLDLRLPNALVSGRMDSSVGAMSPNTLTASALATDAVTEIQAGLALQTTSLAIKAKTDLISATGAVVTSSPVTTTGSVRPIVIGDDYLAANGRAFTWTLSAIAGITPGTATAYFGGTSTGSPQHTFLVTGTVTDNGNGTWTVSCDMPRATSATLLEQQYEWTLGIQAAGGTRVTPVRWGERLQAVESHTW